MTAQDWVKQLDMLPHPEGGWYKEVLRSDQNIDLPEFNGTRSLYTSIYYILEKGQFSALHKIKSDEVWYYQGGGAMEVVMISPEGDASNLVVGPREDGPVALQDVVPAGYLFGARPYGDAEYSLVACMVTPGFDFQDFEMPSRKELLEEFPTQKELILEFTR